MNCLRSGCRKRVMTFEHTGGNVSEAARLLGLTWQSLDRRLEKYGLKHLHNLKHVLF